MPCVSRGQRPAACQGYPRDLCVAYIDGMAGTALLGRNYPGQMSGWSIEREHTSLKILGQDVEEMVL